MVWFKNLQTDVVVYVCRWIYGVVKEELLEFVHDYYIRSEGWVWNILVPFIAHFTNTCIEWDTNSGINNCYSKDPYICISQAIKCKIWLVERYVHDISSCGTSGRVKKWSIGSNIFYSQAHLSGIWWASACEIDLVHWTIKMSRVITYRSRRPTFTLRPTTLGMPR